MLGNTIDVTVGITPVTLTRINQDGYSSEYLTRDALKEYRIRVRHTKTKANGSVRGKDRHNVELTCTTYATDTTPEVSSKVYLVIEQPPEDIDIDLATALFDLAVANDGALLNSLMQWES